MSSKDLKTLANAFSTLQTSQEIADFLRDIATVSEIKAMAERLEVACKVAEGMPYRKIAETVGSSTATITRVAHWFHHGMGGYRMVMERQRRD